MVIERYKIACHHKYGGNVLGGIKFNSFSLVLCSFVFISSLRTIHHCDTSFVYPTRSLFIFIFRLKYVRILEKFKNESYRKFWFKIESLFTLVKGTNWILLENLCTICVMCMKRRCLSSNYFLASFFVAYKSYRKFTRNNKCCCSANSSLQKNSLCSALTFFAYW